MYKKSNLRVLSLTSIFFIMAVTSISLAGDIIYVKQGGTGTGTSWAYPYGQLQDALTAAAGEPNQIWVAAGTYYPSMKIDGTGDRYRTFQLLNNVAIYGGFAATGNPAWGDRNPNTYVTILSGDLLGNDNLTTPAEDLLNDPNRAENCYHVFYHPSTTNLDTTAVLDGFTITAGNSIDTGGGIYNGNSSPTVINCTFSRNAAGYGGGMYNSNGSNPIVTNCIFSGNYGEGSGGGMLNIESSPIMTNCTFSGNSTSQDSQSNTTGGGMANTDSSPMLVNCIFSGNSAGPDVGGIANYEKNSTQINMLFIFTSGGGMYNQGSTPTLVNCTFSGNYSSNRGGGMANYNCNPIVPNCILWGNIATRGPQIFHASATPTITYSDIAGDGSGTGNIDSAPRFIDADGSDNIAGTEDDNLRLSPDSPCIDAGDNTAVPAGITTDLSGFGRFIDDICTADTGNGISPVVDMGAYEFLRSDIDSNGDVNFKDFGQFVLYWLDIACGACGGADLTCDGDVNGDDLKKFFDNWLEGTGP